MSEDWTRFCTRLLHDLVALPSMNPAERSDYDPAVYGEARVVDYVASFFRSRDDRVALRRMPVLPGRENLIVDVGMDAGKETVLLETHADTVEAEGMAFAPFSPFVQNGRLYGRGSCDAKGQLTAINDVVRAAEVYRDFILHGGEPSRSGRGKEPDGDAGRAV